jgi:hypothetical protein
LPPTRGFSGRLTVRANGRLGRRHLSRNRYDAAPTSKGRFGPPEDFVARKAAEPRRGRPPGNPHEEVSLVRDALLALCAYIVTIVIVTRR